MAVRGGQILTYGGVELMSRMPQVGASEPQLNRSKLYETGNAQTTGDTRDIPNVPFEVRSYDMTCHQEAVILGLDPSSLVASQELDLAAAVPVDFVMPWKDGLRDYDVNAGVIAAYQYLESVSYRFGVRASAEQSFNFRGDNLFYVTEGVPRYQEFAASGTGPYNFANGPAIATVEQGEDVFAYSVCIIETDGTVTRLYHGEDYTDTATGVTLVDAAPALSTVKVTYAGPGPVEFPQSIHPSSTLVPADIRPAQIQVFISTIEATPVQERLRGIQQIEATQRFTREPDEELGNSRYVAYDYETPEASGSMTMRAPDIAYYMSVVARILGVNVGETANILSEVALDLDFVIRHPSTGDVLKTIYVPSVRFNPPPATAQANAKMDQQISYTSDTGAMLIYNGERP